MALLHRLLLLLLSTSLCIIPQIHYTAPSPASFVLPFFTVSFAPLIPGVTVVAGADTINYDSVGDVVLTLKHNLGRIKSSLDSDSLEQAQDLIVRAEKILKQWRTHIVAKIEQRDNPMISDTTGEVVIPDPAEFHVKVTHVPKRCTRTTSNGSTLKVHFVGKLLSSGKKGKAFDSSFHTGSMPYKFTLGTASAKVQGWNQGLLDMCQGERRTLTIPYTLGYGEKGIAGKVPPYSNLKYMIELVEFSGGKHRDL
jgi:FKBP-type peptidyl-prolyl cis-trans isomerase